MALKEY